MTTAIKKPRKVVSRAAKPPVSPFPRLVMPIIPELLTAGYAEIDLASFGTAPEKGLPFYTKGDKRMLFPKTPSHPQWFTMALHIGYREEAIKLYGGVKKSVYEVTTDQPIYPFEVQQALRIAFNEQPKKYEHWPHIASVVATVRLGKHMPPTEDDRLEIRLRYWCSFIL